MAKCHDNSFIGINGPRILKNILEGPPAATGTDLAWIAWVHEPMVAKWNATTTFSVIPHYFIVDGGFVCVV